MKENLFETQYDVSKKSKIRKFYESNKILIILLAFILFAFLSFSSFYLVNNENNKILASEKYIQAKIYLDKGNKIEATNILKEVIFKNDPTYSTLCFFLILNQKLITDYKEISFLFDHLISNNKFEKEIGNLLIYKKTLFDSNFIDESVLLDKTKLLLNEKTVWRPHALLLLGDFFVSKGEYLKAKEFYLQTLSISNLQKNLYDYASTQLILIAND